ncbi:MAG: hypothetical protein LBR53_00535 [Deltaproteobacteria bacterium]|jgi:tetratricopeptide (TPR) repeat protein|nr:hypothetical protein [Deltaproteobacteria bacterium]
MISSELKKFAKKASLAYSLSASLAADAAYGPYADSFRNPPVLEKMLTEAKTISDAVEPCPESSALQYASALMELTRAYALVGNLEMVEELFQRLPDSPRSAELDFITAESAYAIGDLSLKRGFTEKALSVYREFFPSSLGSELIRLDLAALLVDKFLEDGEPLKARELFLSYLPENGIEFFCRVHRSQENYAREEFSKTLLKIARKIADHARDAEDTGALDMVSLKLKNLSNVSTRF